jgi:hypothetical protein
MKRTNLVYVILAIAFVFRRANYEMYAYESQYENSHVLDFHVII